MVLLETPVHNSAVGMQWTSAVDQCSGPVQWTGAVDQCSGPVQWTSAVDQCSGSVQGISPLNFFEIRVQNPAFWALFGIVLLWWSWLGEKVVRPMPDRPERLLRPCLRALETWKSSVLCLVQIQCGVPCL